MSLTSHSGRVQGESKPGSKGGWDKGLENVLESCIGAAVSDQVKSGAKADF